MGKLTNFQWPFSIAMLNYQSQSVDVQDMTCQNRQYVGLMQQSSLGPQLSQFRGFITYRFPYSDSHKLGYAPLVQFLMNMYIYIYIHVTDAQVNGHVPIHDHST